MPIMPNEELPQVEPDNQDQILGYQDLIRIQGDVIDEASPVAIGVFERPIGHMPRLFDGMIVRVFSRFKQHSEYKPNELVAMQSQTSTGEDGSRISLTRRWHYDSSSPEGLGVIGTDVLINFGTNLRRLLSSDIVGDNDWVRVTQPMLAAENDGGETEIEQGFTSLRTHMSELLGNNNTDSLLRIFDPQISRQDHEAKSQPGYMSIPVATEAVIRGYYRHHGYAISTIAMDNPIHGGELATPTTEQLVNHGTFGDLDGGIYAHASQEGNEALKRALMMELMITADNLAQQMIRTIKGRAEQTDAANHGLRDILALGEDTARWQLRAMFTNQLAEMVSASVRQKDRQGRDIGMDLIEANREIMKLYYRSLASEEMARELNYAKEHPIDEEEQVITGTAMWVYQTMDTPMFEMISSESGSPRFIDDESVLEFIAFADRNYRNPFLRLMLALHAHKRGDVETQDAMLAAAKMTRALMQLMLSLSTQDQQGSEDQVDLASLDDPDKDPLGDIERLVDSVGKNRETIMRNLADVYLRVTPNS